MPAARRPEIDMPTLKSLALSVANVQAAIDSLAPGSRKKTIAARHLQGIYDELDEMRITLERLDRRTLDGSEAPSPPFARTDFSSLKTMIGSR